MPRHAQHKPFLYKIYTNNNTTLNVFGKYFVVHLCINKKVMKKSKRIAFIKAWLKETKSNKIDICDEGICISFGKTVYDNYYAAPWVGWGGLCEIFPEFDVYKCPGRIDSILLDSHKHRQLIRQSLRLKLNKKKDIIRQTNPEIFV